MPHIYVRISLMVNDLFEYDRSYNLPIVGTDEAGRGPASGGVFAAAVYFPNNGFEIEKELAKLNDSKKLSKKNREELYKIIKHNTINSVVCIEVCEIEKINILNSSLKAMKLVCEEVISQLNKSKILTLVDGNRLIKNYSYPQKYVIKGDSKSASIAAASILAKVERDWYMEKLDLEYPEYNWQKNAGYLTKQHIEAIHKFGITKYHRKSFLKKILNKSLQEAVPHGFSSSLTSEKQLSLLN